MKTVLIALAFVCTIASPGWSLDGRGGVIGMQYIQSDTH